MKNSIVMLGLMTLASSSIYAMEQSEITIEHVPNDVLSSILAPVLMQPDIDKAISQLIRLRQVNKQFKRTTETVPFIVKASEQLAHSLNLPPRMVALRIMRVTKPNTQDKEYLLKRYQADKSLDKRLFEAIDKRKVGKVLELLERNADVTARDHSGRTPILAVSADKIGQDLLKLLINAGADVNAASVGYTPLMQAVNQNAKDKVRLLIAAGADINAQDSAKHTALMYAAIEGRRDIVEVLIKAGAHVNTKNLSGDTALSFAKKNNYKDIVELLIKAGATE